MPRVPRALIALTALAAALRLPTLGSQSLWLDEVLTGNLARGSLGDLFHVVAQQEANPPLFYLFEWVWTRVAGTSEFALRLPSALCGIALVPVGYAIGKKLAGERTAVALAALVAVHPLLVYYSQEARGYSAVALACAVGFFCFLDDRPLGWAIASAVALGCHYFAIFPVAIEAAILLWRGRRAAVAAVVVVGASLLPLRARAAARRPRRQRDAGRRARHPHQGGRDELDRRGARRRDRQPRVARRRAAARRRRPGDPAPRGADAGARRRWRSGADAAHRARRRRLHQQPQHDRGAWRSRWPSPRSVTRRGGPGCGWAERPASCSWPRRSAR